MNIPITIRLKLIRQELLAMLGLEKRVRLSDDADGWIVEAEGKTIRVPSPQRWKLYRQGWAARLGRLEQEYGIARHVRLDASSVVIDVGANVGEFAHVCARYGATVHCFEPDPAANACLVRNIADLPNAHAHGFVIWEEDGSVDFGEAPERADSSVFVREGAAPHAAKTIATFARENGLDRIDFIKCDAEGAEPEVLEGIGDFFPRVRAIALDTGPERAGERTHAACAAILEGAGMRVVEEKIGTRWMTYGLRD